MLSSKFAQINLVTEPPSPDGTKNILASPAAGGIQALQQ